MRDRVALPGTDTGPTAPPLTLFLQVAPGNVIMLLPIRMTRPSLLGAWILETQMTALKKKIHAHSDAGIHACRHTFLTEAGKYTDPFTLQYVAGHDSIKTTMRYVHPQEDTVEI